MTTMPITRTEEFALRICQRTFLSSWCYNNPRGKNSKELCDILVVCEPHVIIVSVKEVVLRPAQNSDVEIERWERRAIDASVRQLYGADRWLASATYVIRSHGSQGLALPSKTVRCVHRIAVAFGGRGEVPIKSGDLGKGYVHVMDERSFVEVLTELDTIGDLVHYLSAKEALVTEGCAVLINGSESDLLGWYLFHQRSFPVSPDLMIIGDDIWHEIKERPEFRRRKEADQESYYWDKLIELLSDPDAKGVEEAGPSLNELEVSLRVMARETRFSRRGLGKAVRSFFEQAKQGKLRSRIMAAFSGVTYVLVHFRADEDQKLRMTELGNRCFLARHAIGSGEVVIGIGISQYVSGLGSASDLVYWRVGEWSAAEDETAARMKNDLGYFSNSVLQQSHEDEFPVAD